MHFAGVRPALFSTSNFRIDFRMSFFRICVNSTSIRLPFWLPFQHHFHVFCITFSELVFASFVDRLSIDFCTPVTSKTMLLSLSKHGFRKISFSIKNQFWDPCLMPFGITFCSTWHHFMILFRHRFLHRFWDAFLFDFWPKMDPKTNPNVTSSRLRAPLFEVPKRSQNANLYFS